MLKFSSTSSSVFEKDEAKCLASLLLSLPFGDAAAAVVVESCAYSQLGADSRRIFGHVTYMALQFMHL